jgi:hypothetical protein
MTKYNIKAEETFRLEKSFGTVFFILFALLGLYPIIKGESINYWFLIVALTFILIAFFSPRTLSIPSNLWMSLGILLSTIISPIVMSFIYFTTVVPVGLVFRLIGKDVLCKKFDKNTQSYWVERKQHLRSMRDQF